MSQLASIVAIIGVLIACALLFGYFSKNFTKSEMPENLNASHCKCSPLHSNIFVPKNEYRVVNGKIVTDPKDFPYTASLLLNYDGKPRFFCTGSVITPSYVLTAAHCVSKIISNEYPKEDVIIASGLDHDLNKILKSNDNIRKINKVIQHRGYDEDSIRSSDIGLVKLDKPFEFNEKTKIAPACLYGLREYNLSYLVQAGYGRTEPFLIKDKNKPKKEDYELPELRMMYFTQFDDYDSYLKLKSDRSSACSGDSGSGVGHVDSNNRYFLIGVMMSVLSESKNGEIYFCLPDSGNLIVSIQYFADFIIYNVEDGQNLCHTRLIITDRSKVLIYWLIVSSIIIIIGVFLFLLFDIKIEQFNLSPVRSLIHPNKPPLNLNKPLFNPNQPLFNPNQPLFNPNQPLFNQNQPLFNPNQPLFNPNQASFNQNQASFNPNQPLHHSLPPFNSNQPPFNSNQPFFNPKQPSFNPNQPIFNPNQPPFIPNQPFFHHSRPPFQYYPKDFPIRDQST